MALAIGSVGDMSSMKYLDHPGRGLKPGECLSQSSFLNQFLSVLRHWGKTRYDGALHKGLQAVKIGQLQQHTHTSVMPVGVSWARRHKMSHEGLWADKKGGRHSLVDGIKGDYKKRERSCSSDDET